MENSTAKINEQSSFSIEQLLAKTRNTSIWLKIISICILLVSFVQIYIAYSLFSTQMGGFIDLTTIIVMGLFFSGPLALAITGIMAASNADKAYKSKSPEDIFRFFKSLNVWYGILAILAIIMAFLILMGFAVMAGLNSDQNLFF